uniref:Ribosomal RNA-processing protein 43 n=1 Tax=Albugo laibachii Nc14 TaxID=890382 RepID=F0W033_9STRA|nr:exosome complex exonuclease RRP43 putative [Albugo laibachii Nc14]|eukprot:CCA14404.1 exosome complex exonuclease RRP43 putative [Albugo laibachii Nc14]
MAPATPANTTAVTYDPSVYRKLFVEEYTTKCLENEIRTDARTFDASRSMHIQTNVINSCYSSSLVKLKNTSVITGIQLAVGTPAIDKQTEGDIVIQIHLTPLCSTRFNVGRACEEANAVSSHISKIIRRARMIDLTQLSIEKGKSAWNVMIDVYCIDYDGNIFEVSLMSIMTALQKLRLPATRVSEVDHKVEIDSDEESRPLIMQRVLCATSFAIVNEHVLIDPTSEEEGLASSTFNIIYTTENELFGVYKPGGTLISPAILKKCLDTAKNRTKKVAKQLLESLSQGDIPHNS